jgi:hypothetical protein
MHLRLHDPQGSAERLRSGYCLLRARRHGPRRDGNAVLSEKILRLILMKIHRHHRLIRAAAILAKSPRSGQRVKMLKSRTARFHRLKVS